MFCSLFSVSSLYFWRVKWLCVAGSIYPLRVVCSRQIPAGIGAWDAAMSGEREVKRGWSVGSTGEGRGAAAGDLLRHEGWGWGFGSRGREKERGGVWEFKIHWYKKISRPFSFCLSHWILSGDMYANLLTPDPAIVNASVKLIQGNIISGVTACDAKIPVVFTLIVCTVLMTRLTFPCISIFYLQHRTDCEQLDLK